MKKFETPKNESQAGLFDGEAERLMSRFRTSPSPAWQRPYNGFSWEERCAVTPIQNAAFRDGRLSRPTRCSICGYSYPEDPRGKGYIFAHLEDYSQPLCILPTCKRCHAALHARFEQPRHWQTMVRQHWRQGSPS
jgi:hypothetical protein